MTDVDGVDERIAHQAADQTDDAICGEDARGRVLVARGASAHYVIHRFDEVVDPEGDRGDEDDADELKAAEDVTQGGRRDGNVKTGQGIREVAGLHDAEDPRNDRSDRDGHQAGGGSPKVPNTAKPARENDGEAKKGD